MACCPRRPRAGAQQQKAQHSSGSAPGGSTPQPAPHHLRAPAPARPPAHPPYEAVVGGAEHLAAVAREGERGHALGVRRVKPPQALPRPHPPHLDLAVLRGERAAQPAKGSVCQPPGLGREATQAAVQPQNHKARPRQARPAWLAPPPPPRPALPRWASSPGAASQVKPPFPPNQPPPPTPNPHPSLARAAARPPGPPAPPRPAAPSRGRRRGRAPRCRAS